MAFRKPRKGAGGVWGKRHSHSGKLGVPPVNWHGQGQGRQAVRYLLNPKEDLQSKSDFGLRLRRVWSRG